MLVIGWKDNRDMDISLKGYCQELELPKKEETTSCSQREVEDCSPDKLPPLTRAILAQRAKRTCLKCGQAFMSAGPHNRLCDWCKELMNWDDGDEDRIKGVLFLPPEDPHRHIPRRKFRGNTGPTIARF